MLAQGLELDSGLADFATPSRMVVDTVVWGETAGAGSSTGGTTGVSAVVSADTTGVVKQRPSGSEATGSGSGFWR